MISCCWFTSAVADVDEIQPAPASIGSDVPATYFGPPPSSVQPELIGPHQLLTAGTLDTEAGTITLPLYHGRIRKTGEDVWYIVTDTDDAANAAALGINHSAKLSYAEHCRGVRTAEYDRDGTLIFDYGSVDFSPERKVVAGNTVNVGAPVFPPSRPTTVRYGI